MKKIIAILLAILLTGVIPLYAVTLEFTPNEKIDVNIPADWYMDENKKLYNTDGAVGYTDGISYEEPITDINKASLDFLKAKLLNNIMLIENIGEGIHIYEADTTSGTAFVFTSVNGTYDYIVLMCVYQNKISYTNFKALSQSVAIEFIAGEIIVEEEIPEIEDTEAVEEIVEETKKGDSIGTIVSTDIITFIDGMPITSYNVDGSTVVIVEELVNYGFKVIWDGEARKLIVTAGKLPSSAPEYVNSTSDLPIGTPVGEIYETDIITEINGREYQSYNMNGQTVVVLEPLGDRMIDTDINIYNPYKYSSGGFKTLWDNDTRSLEVHCIRPGDKIDTWAGSISIKEIDVVMKPVEYTLSQYAVGYDVIQALKIGSRTFVDLQKYAELKGVTCTLEKSNSITVDTSGLKDIEITLANILDSEVKTDMLLPLNLILTNGKSSARSNNSNIAYYYKDGAVMVDINAVKNIIG
jgi:hypothetical protein